MNSLKKLTTSLGVCVLGIVGISNAKLLEHWEIGQYRNIFQENFEIIKQNINKDLLNTDLKCNYKSRWNFFEVEPSCFIQGDMPRLDSPQKAFEHIQKYIDGFDSIYDLDATSFVYEPSSINYKPNSPKAFKLSNFIDPSQSSDLYLYILLDSLWYTIKLPKSSIALNQMENYSLYVSDKDLTKRYGCRLTNYNIAMWLLDDMVIGPWKTYNFNTALASKQTEYCTWSSKRQYLFNSGVCGVSTKLFRNWLINPYTKVTERYSHTNRLVNFYDEYIYGDDASVYERDKQLHIKNISNKPIYFNVYKSKWHSYLLALYPGKTSLSSMVTRKQTSSLKSIVWSNVFNKNTWNIRYEQFWLSNYLSRSYEN